MNKVLRLTSGTCLNDPRVLLFCARIGIWISKLIRMLYMYNLTIDQSWLIDISISIWFIRHIWKWFDSLYERKTLKNQMTNIKFFVTLFLYEIIIYSLDVISKNGNSGLAETTDCLVFLFFFFEEKILYLAISRNIIRKYFILVYFMLDRNTWSI